MTQSQPTDPQSAHSHTIHSHTALSRIYRPIDALLSFVAHLGSVAMVILVTVTMYDVSTRYLGVPKFAGLNSTMVQESEYWAHAFLFSLVIGYAYTKQAHVRIDLVRDLMPTRARYVMELLGIVCLLMPFATISLYYCFQYALKSYVDGEVSPSTNGLSHFWILKSTLVALAALLILAGVSQALKCIDGLRGKLPERQVREVLGGEQVEKVRKVGSTELDPSSTR